MDYLCESCHVSKPKAFFVQLNGTLHKCNKCMNKVSKCDYSIVYDKNINQRLKTKSYVK